MINPVSYTHLYLSQPTVSAHISALEKELAVPLLIRNTREVYTSEAGQQLYDYACRLIRLRDCLLYTSRCV